MRAYRNLVLDLLEGFKEYELLVIPRNQNIIVDALVVSTSVFKITIYTNRKYEIKVKYRPSIPDNVKYWQVFEHDSHINRFMTLTDEFENLAIDQDKEEEHIKDANQNEGVFLNQIADKEIIQLKNNYFPIGLIPLEELFDHNDVAKCPGVVPSGTEVEDLNIGTDENPKLIKISKYLFDEATKEYLVLFEKYIDVFSWKYEYTKVYDTSVIQHTIPIKENEKLFWQNLRRINPLLLPLIEKEIRNLFDAKIIVSLRHS